MDSEDKTSVDVREGTPPASAKNEEPKAPPEAVAKSAEGETKANDRSDGNKKPAKDKCSKKHVKRKSKKPKKPSSPAESASDSDSSDGTEATSSSSSSDDSQSEAEDSKKKRATKRRQDSQKAKKKTRAKRHGKAAKPSASSDSGSDSESSDRRDAESSDDEAAQLRQAELTQQLQLLLLQQQQRQQHPGGSYPYSAGINHSIPPPIYDSGLRHNPPRARRGGIRPGSRANLGLGGIDAGLLLDANQQQKEKKKRKATKLDYKRVDQVWDDSIHNYKLQDTAEGTVDAQYDEFIFHVRRTFDWEGKYKATIVDIKSKLLRECLQEVMGGIKGVSLVDETPKLDPNMLFL